MTVPYRYEKEFQTTTCIWYAVYKKVSLPNTCGANSLKKTDNKKPANTPTTGCGTGGSFPEHTQEEHGKYTRANKAGIFLNIGKSTYATDTQQIVPGKHNSQVSWQQKQLFCPVKTRFLSSAFFTEIFFMNIKCINSRNTVYFTSKRSNNGSR